MQNAKATPDLSHLDATDSAVKIDFVKVGRVKFCGVEISNAKSRTNFEELLRFALEKTARPGARRNGTIYPPTLPLATPAGLLSEEIADYLLHMKRRNIRPSSIEASARALSNLQRVCGDIRVTSIERRHIYMLCDLLRWQPRSRAHSDRELKLLSAEELIELGKSMNVPSPAPSSLALQRALLSAFFNALLSAKAIAASPMDAFGKVRKDLVGVQPKRNRSLGNVELQRIFEPTGFAPWAKKWPHRWWGPILGLYTGSRIGEIAQLKVADIALEEGTWFIYLRVTADDDLAGAKGTKSRQSLKGPSSVRKVPIAQPVLDAGFLEFLEDIKECKHPRLFPHLSAGINQKTGETNARYSHALVHQFGAYMKTLGFSKGVSFHSFRHTLINSLISKGYTTSQIAAITGHSTTGQVREDQAPVIREAYEGMLPEHARPLSVKMLEDFTPPVVLPKYVRGQFKERLRDKKSFYP
ncbi:site-specific integrase [Stenotrophomonas lactitubi]|uniref:site-specific integrase n=1 Tax=Stenotrophomonas lactitubi TaxID=2045214 RepID=UPI00203DE755|nr:site-specific integrase [Stenotrophomonas lactitubi]